MFISILFALFPAFKKVKKEEPHYPLPPIQPFSVSQYLARLEQTQVDLLSKQEPVDQTIILWWGLDGLRLNKNGDLEWISRKKPEPPLTPVYPSYMDFIQAINAPIAV